MRHRGRRDGWEATVVLVAFAGLLGVGLLAPLAGPVSAAAAPPGIALYETDGTTPATHGLAGSKVLLHAVNLTNANCGTTLTYYFDAKQIGVSTAPVGALPQPYPNITVKVPAGAAPGAHTFSAPCTNPATGGQVTYKAPFTVDPPPTTTTTTTLPATTTTSTGKGTTTTTVKGQTTTTKPGQTTTTSSTVPGQTTTTAKGTSKGHPHGTTTTTAPGATSTKAGASVHLDALAIAPGSSVKAIGRGCDPDATVDLTIDSKPVGQTTATSDGSFQATLAVATLQVGRYQVVATCGPVMTTPLDVVLASHVDPGTATTMVIIVFFVMIGLLAFRRQLFPSQQANGPSVEPADRDDEFDA